jgi:hypothetical protein
VSTEPVDFLAKKIMDRYNRHPVGWTVLRDLKGNVLVTGPKEGYMLKMITINPQEYTGIGVQIDNPRELRTLVEGAPLFGYRPLARIQAEELLNSFRNGRHKEGLISEILERKPIPALEIEKKRPSAVLTGPIIAHPDLSTISKSQRELEMKLRIGAEKLFREKYPHRAEMYR